MRVIIALCALAVAAPLAAWIAPADTPAPRASVAHTFTPRAMHGNLMPFSLRGPTLFKSCQNVFRD